MSEAASRERAFKQDWAVPGSRHDRLIKLAKIALPSAVGVLIAFLALAPLDREGDVSFILDKNEVDNAPERMRVEEARYVGEDDKGQPFQIVAQRALQQTSDEPIVDIWGMMARLGLAQGPLSIAANKARYDLDAQRVLVQGPVRVSGPDGYQLATSNVLVDLKSRSLESRGGVSGRMELGEFRAGRLQANLGERTVVLDKGARLKIVQGAVR
jgi:lipopolysaccharide export system protein LptC